MVRVEPVSRTLREHVRAGLVPVQLTHQSPSRSDPGVPNDDVILLAVVVSPTTTLSTASRPIRGTFALLTKLRAFKNVRLGRRMIPAVAGVLPNSIVEPAYSVRIRFDPLPIS